MGMGVSLPSTGIKAAPIDRDAVLTDNDNEILTDNNGEALEA